MKKSGKISEIFGKIWGIFRKKLLALKVQISKIFENFLALKVQKFGGIPPNLPLICILVHRENTDKDVAFHNAIFLRVHIFIFWIL